MLIQAHMLRRNKQVCCDFQRNVCTEITAYKISDKGNFCCKYEEQHVNYLKSGSWRRQCTAGYDRLKLGICTLNSVSQHNISGYVEIPCVFCPQTVFVFCENKQVCLLQTTLTTSSFNVDAVCYYDVGNAFLYTVQIKIMLRRSTSGRLLTVQRMQGI